MLDIRVIFVCSISCNKNYSVCTVKVRRWQEKVKAMGTEEREWLERNIGGTLKNLDEEMDIRQKWEMLRCPNSFGLCNPGLKNSSN